MVINMDFQTLDTFSFENAENFVAAFAGEILDLVEEFPEGIEEKFSAFEEKNANFNSLNALFRVIKDWCRKAARPLVLIIDEVDSASNNQILIDFLAQLRAYYLKRARVPAIHSVILAGVYDIRSIRMKIRSDQEHKENSLWNIAADFDIDMSFSTTDIEGMLSEYEKDYHTGMNLDEIAGLIYTYTAGYPVLVSRLCKLLDEKIAGTPAFPDKRSAWSRDGFHEALKRIIKEDNPLYESILGKLRLYPELKAFLQELLFNGIPIPYVATSPYIKDAAMFGFIRNVNETCK
ncbi:MAG: AAA family ATPase [Lachnospiraceae bacterium]|nr:AAA family ATPase [Lachnospiraceae bacterium]